MKIAQSLTMKESKMASTLPGLFYQVTKILRVRNTATTIHTAYQYEPCLLWTIKIQVTHFKIF